MTKTVLCVFILTLQLVAGDTRSLFIVEAQIALGAMILEMPLMLLVSQSLENLVRTTPYILRCQKPLSAVTAKWKEATTLTQRQSVRLFTSVVEGLEGVSSSTAFSVQMDRFSTRNILFVTGGSM